MTAIFNLAAMTGGSMIPYSHRRVEGQPSASTHPISMLIAFCLRPFTRQKPPATSSDSSG
ncbi:hypothetical protein [Rhizobium sp. BR 314]|uniref:hypothetical protein n=1 Tax=Rhizobium sp. BR 314 TaxID=3040013 RepID=UPI0039BF0DDE